MNDVVWVPDEEQTNKSQIARFLSWLADQQDLRFEGYMDAWQWSTQDPDAFWDLLWRYEDVIGHRGTGAALAQEQMPGAVWFPGAQLNYAEHLLRRAAQPTTPALVAVAEDEGCREISWQELAAQAGALAQTLRDVGIDRGDRVVAYINNLPEAVVALIATASIGAVWSVCAPDFGTAGVLARFQQLQPKALVAVDGYRFGGREFSRCEEVREIVAGLPSLQQVIWVDSLHPGRAPPVAATRWADAVAGSLELRFERVPFDHPLWVLYSSGTTGNPKGIVQGHGGILLEHLKSGRLGTDLRPADRILYLASTSWMVWNAMVSGLLTGSSAVLLDGNPVGSDMRRVWRTVERLGVTMLGVGASFLHASIKAGVRPHDDGELEKLRQILSTGSPLAPDAYTWILEHVGPRVWINSASGGTDICSIFVGGCPLLPVRTGRLQAPSLGAAVAAWDESGHEVINERGELVVTRPMPSMPLYLWKDPNGTRYRESYFSVYPGVWRHGDFISFDVDGSSVILGRSDATLNRHGIRMGSAEIYAIVEALPEVREAMVVGLEEDGGYFMPLFFTPAPGSDPDKTPKLIADAIRIHLSPRHVPDQIVVVPAIPHTKTGKKLEVPITRLLQGSRLVDVLDLAAIDAPELIEWYSDFAKSHISERRSPGRLERGPMHSRSQAET